MLNSIRSDSYSESVQRGLRPLTTTPIALQRRSATMSNVNRASAYEPTLPGISSSMKSIAGSTSTSLMSEHGSISFLALALVSRPSQQRLTNESPLKKSGSLPKSKPPREVSLRVKFIRLGEVSRSSRLRPFTHLLLTATDQYLAREVLRRGGDRSTMALRSRGRLMEPESLREERPGRCETRSGQSVRQQSRRTRAGRHGRARHHLRVGDPQSRRHILGETRTEQFPCRCSATVVTDRQSASHRGMRARRESLPTVDGQSRSFSRYTNVARWPPTPSLLRLLAQQEWFLYEHIETRSTINNEEFTFRPIRQSTFLGKCHPNVPLDLVRSL